MQGIYQLVCRGDLRYAGGRNSISSRQVYRSRSAALAAAEAFKARCCDSGDGMQSLYDIDIRAAEVHVLELELQDEGQEAGDGGSGG